MDFSTPDSKSAVDAAIGSFDRRTTARQRILQRCFVRPAAAEGDEGWKAIAYDISTTGIGVALPYPLAIGTMLRIEPAGCDATRFLVAHVAGVRAVAHLWFTGCVLSEPLNPAELQFWLATRVDPETA